MKKIILSISIFCFLALTASEGFACSCQLSIVKQSLKTQVKRAYKNSAAVFYGEVIEINRKPENFYVAVKFKIEKSWKNQSEGELIIQTGQGGGDCGYNFEVGKKYLVYAYGDETNFGTNICQRTSASDADSKYLDKIKRPKLFPE